MKPLNKTAHYLVRNPHSFCFRINVPRDLQQLVGRKELRYSLKTGYVGIARIKAQVIAGQVHQIYQCLRKGGRRLADLTDEKIQEMVQRYLKESIEVLEARYYGEDSPIFTSEELSGYLTELDLIRDDIVGYFDVEKATAWLTVKALAMTVYLASALPFLAGLVGYQLASAHEADDFSRAVGGGLLLATRTLAVTAFLYHLCRRDGLAEAHFAWPEEARRSLRHNVLWVTQLLVPISFVLGMIEVEGTILYYNSLGRFASIGGFIGIAVLFVRVLRSSGATGSFLRERHLKDWVFRLRHLWCGSRTRSPGTLPLNAEYMQLADRSPATVPLLP